MTSTTWMRPWFRAVIASLFLAGWTPAVAQAANNAAIDVGGSSVPASMSAGSTASVRVRVRNTGTTNWTAGTMYRLGALPSGSFNQVSWGGFPCGGYMLSPTNGRVFLCNNVAPGATYDFNFNITVPGGASGSMRFAVRMVRDGVEWFGASHAFTISVGSAGLPDVVVDSVAVSPANPSPGQSVTFSAVVRNAGSAPTPTETVIGVGYRIDGPQVTWGSVNGPLAPGATVTVGTQGGVWRATSGTHTLTAVADDVNRFPESNENNNGRSTSFTVGSPGLPDVVVDSVAVSPANPRPGQSVTFSAVVRNVGSAPTPSGTVIGVGYRIDGRQVSWGVVNGPLAAGATVAVGTHSGGAWTATSGTHTLTAVVDDVNRFPESNENNNGRSTSFTVGSPGLPDVVVNSVAISPSNPNVGQAVSFSAVVQNVGSAPTPSGTVIGVGYRIDGRQVSWGVVNGPLAAGATVTVGTQGGSWTATSGGHTVTAVADDVDRFPESNENNNGRSTSFTVSGNPPPPPPGGDGPVWIFGMHDPGAEGEMEAKGKRGWIVFTEAIGSNPGDHGGRDYRPWSDRGHGVIVRLNNGYEGSGTLPFQSQYQDFARRVANYIQSSPGADIWIIGNETNLPREWPGNNNGDPNSGEAITPARYVDCYNRVYNELQRRGLGSEILVPAPTGTWAPPYDGTIQSLPNRGVPGFLDYWVQVLNALGSTKVKGLAIHAYTHGGDGSAPIDPNLVFSEGKMDPPYQNIYYHFRVYKNFMHAIPGSMRSLPVWITEANEFRKLDGYNWDPHPNTIQWVKNVYSEINNWNARNSQKIRAVALFRWQDVMEGRRNYCISCVGSATEGFRQALDRDYRWDRPTVSRPILTPQPPRVKRPAPIVKRPPRGVTRKSRDVKTRSRVKRKSRGVNRQSQGVQRNRGISRRTLPKERDRRPRLERRRR